MIVELLTLVTIALMSYAGFLKLAARLLRYSVSWKVSFLFAGIMLATFILHHVLVFSAPAALRIGLGLMLLLGLIILGGWFFSGRGRNRDGTILGWGGGIRLMALMFAIMIFVGFVILVPAQIFLSNHPSPTP